MTPEQMAGAIKTALATALADIPPTGSVKAYDYDEIPGGQYGNVPGELPARYVAIDISRRYVPERRYSGEVMLPGHRLGTRYCAATMTTARELQRRIVVALEDVILASDLGPFSFEVESEPIHPDALGFTGVIDWIF